MMDIIGRLERERYRRFYLKVNIAKPEHGACLKGKAGSSDGPRTRGQTHAPPSGGTHDQSEGAISLRRRSP